MALYEYRCQDCKTVFTVSESIREHEKDHDAPNCPECGSRHTRQLMSGFFAQTSSKS